METKALFTSKTVWGTIIMFVALFLSKKGHVINDELQSSTVDFLVGAVGAALAMYGRWVATKPLSLTGTP